ncbi:TrkA family potassium uptake protein [candidate division KSB1 bacterium]|nr:TrkA family potassium uptake protein [candidate division KSB1 bacterium]
MRSFTIIGLSTFGYFLAKYLAANGHTIMVIDRDEEKIDKIKSFVYKAIIADATDKSTLSGIGLTEMDAVIVSLGDQIDASILVTLYLHELKVKNIIAKALTEDHGKILEIIGANRIVFPERDEAYRISRTMESDYILDNITLGDGMSIIEIIPPASIVGKSLGQLDLRNKYDVLVLVIKEVVPENVVMIPKANHVIKDSDVLIILGKDKNLEKIKKMK